MAPSPDNSQMVRAWDIPTRLFHWLFVAAMVSAWVSWRFSEGLGDNLLVWHRWNGYAILVLLTFRLLWGVVGSSTARFANFVRWPWDAARYGLDLVRGRDRHFLGHNPLGTYMVLALLAAVALQAGLGLFVVEHNDSGAAGPLYARVSEATYKQITRWHGWVFYNIILVLIPLHILANVLYGLVKKDPLIRAMITGTKPKASYEDTLEADVAPNVLIRALACLGLAMAIVFGGIALLGGKLI